MNWVANLYHKKIFVYHHGHSLNQTALSPTKIYQAESRYFLSFSSLNNEWVESLGYKPQYVIGFPKLFPEWIDLLKKYNDDYQFTNHILIFSRQAIHPFYMDLDKYKSLHVEAYQAVRQFYNDNLIVIKPHPRENTDLINEIILNEKMENVQISNSHAGVLSLNAILAISFFTSAVFDSLDHPQFG